MSIGVVISDTYHYTQTFFESLIQGLQDKGFQVVLIANKRDKSVSKKVVSPMAISSKKCFQVIKTIAVLFWLFFRHPQRSIRFYKLEKINGLQIRKILENLYINAHIFPLNLDWLYFGFATMGLRRENVAKAIGAKSAVSLRGYDISTYPLKHPGCYNSLWTKIDKVHTLSDDLLKKAYALGLDSTVPFSKITPAVDVNFFKANISQEHSFSPIKFLTVGRLEWIKGYEYALQVMSLLKRKGISFTYTIVGEGSDRERLMFAVYQWGLNDYVRFVGKQTQVQIQEWMRETMVYLQPSLYEGFCNAALEAQAMGILCVVTDGGGLQENVVNGKSGFVVPKRDPQAMVEAIEKITQMTDEERQQMRRFAVERVRKDFNLEDQKTKWAAFFNE